MYGVQKIVVGVDLSAGDRLVSGDELAAESQQAIERGIALASYTRAELILAAVIDAEPPTGPSDGPLDEQFQQLLKSAHDRLQPIVDAAQSDGVTASTSVSCGTPAVELIRTVVEEGAGLVIVGTCNKGAAARVLYGSTARQLFRMCPCPVWVTRPDPDPDVNLVLVADDQTEVGQEALFHGVAIAQSMDARLLVVHAIEYPWEQRMLRTGMVNDDVIAHKQKAKEEVTAKIQEHLAATDFRTLTQGSQIVVEEGPPEVVIEQAIEAHSPDLLIMGTKARGGLQGLVLGNTAERLLFSVNCSVIAIKPDDFECPLKF